MKIKVVDMTYEQALAQPDVYNDQDQYRKLTKAHADLRDVVELFRRHRSLTQELEENKQLLHDSDPDIKAMAQEGYVPPHEDFFADELSAELYAWLKMHTKYNPIGALQSAGLGMSYGGEVSLYGLTRKPFDDGTAIRSTFEAAVPEIEASFRDAGLIK